MVEIAAVARVGREAHVGAYLRVAVDGETSVCVQAAREVGAMEHVRCQCVHYGGCYGGQDTDNTQSYENTILCVRGEEGRRRRERKVYIHTATIVGAIYMYL